MKFCLVVDDSDVIRKVAKRIVERLSMVPVEAANAAEAIEKCKADRPDVVLLDWHLPGTDVYDLIRDLKALDPEDAMSIIFCVSEHDPKAINSALAAGARDYVLKPYDLVSIADKMRDEMAD